MSQGAWKEDEPPRQVVLQPSERAAGRGSSHPYAEVLDCLREARVIFAAVQADADRPDALPQLDVLIDARETKIAFAALRRAGFREMRRMRAPQTASTFLRWEHDRFHVLVIHLTFARGGLRYMDAGIALERSERRGAIPVLAREDRFLHLLLHPLLAGEGAAQPVELLRLRHDGIAAERLAAQTRRFGLESIMQRALGDLDALLQDEWRWRRLRARVCWALLRRPDNLRAVWRHCRAEYLRLSYRPVVLAVVGPQRTGKTVFAAALRKLLAGSPLDAAPVSMGCWDAHGILARLVQPFVPGNISWWRLFQARRGRRVALAAEEVRILEASRPGPLALALRAVLHGSKSAIFHALVAGVLWLRYWLRVARSRRPVVLADGWIYDLELRGGREAYTHGQRPRRIVFSCFPPPDGFLYLSTPYETVAARNPRMEHDAFASAERTLRNRLKPHGPLELVVEGSAIEMARTFLSRYWAHLLERHNRHAAPAGSPT